MGASKARNEQRERAPEALDALLRVSADSPLRPGRLLYILCRYGWFEDVKGEPPTSAEELRGIDDEEEPALRRMLSRLAGAERTAPGGIASFLASGDFDRVLHRLAVLRKARPSMVDRPSGDSVHAAPDADGDYARSSRAHEQRVPDSTASSPAFQPFGGAARDRNASSPAHRALGERVEDSTSASPALRVYGRSLPSSDLRDLSWRSEIPVRQAPITEDIAPRSAGPRSGSLASRHPSPDGKPGRSEFAAPGTSSFGTSSPPRTPMPRTERPLEDARRGPAGNVDGTSGAVVGAAIGDAMGSPAQFLARASDLRRFGQDGISAFATYVSDGVSARYAPFTDDSQRAEIVLRTLIEARRAGTDLDGTMESLGRQFAEWARNPIGGHRAPENEVLSACRAMEKGVHWSQSGSTGSGGCGSVAHAYPFGLVFRDEPAIAEEWAVAHSLLTHRAQAPQAACAAMAVGVAYAVRHRDPHFVVTEMIAAAARYCASTAALLADAREHAASGTSRSDYLERINAFFAQGEAPALPMTAAGACIAGAIYIFLRHPDAPRTAILEGANTVGAADTLASCVGALVGARGGLRSLPSEWVSEIERSSELVALAGQVTPR